MKMRKLVAMLMAVMMLCCIIPFSAAAADNSATIDFTDKANRVSYSTEQQVWAQNGITVTNDKAASNSNVGDYGGEGYPVRFYKSSAVTVEYPGMTAIVFYCDDYKDTYATDLADSITDGEVAVDGTVVTVTLAAPVSSFVIAELAAQVRVDSITVYGEGNAPVDPPVDPEPDVPVEPDEPDTPVVPGDSATIDFTDKANRVSYSTEQQVWAQNGITVTNDKAASTSNVGDYGGEGYPVRFYKSSAVTVEYPGMTAIVFCCDDYKDTYATDLADSITDGEVAVDGTVVTVTLAAPVSSFVIAELAAQVRVDSITVYTNGAAPEVPDTPDVPDAPDTPDEPDTPVVPGDSAVLDLTDKANRTEYSSSKQVWKQNGITVTNEKGASTSNVADYANPGRFYKSSTVTIEYPGMTSIVIDSVTYDDNDYAAGWAAIDDANATATVLDGNVTIVFANAVDSFTWEKLVSQSRAYTITVYTNGATPEQPDVPETPDTPDTPDVPAGDVTVVTEPEVDVAYKLGLDQTAKGAIYYFTGKMSGFYGATETDIAQAVDMYLENAEGGYKLYFNDANGAKQYITLSQNGTHYNFTFVGEGSVFSWDAERDALYAPCGDQICYMGTYGTYVTVGTLTMEKLKDTDYIARLYTVGGETPDVPACEHEYDDEYDVDCNLCGEIREVPEKPIEYTGTIEIGTVEGSVGDIVAVAVTLPNNPGVISVKVKVHFDSSVLKFVDYESGNFFAGGYSWSDDAVANENGYFIINWINALGGNDTSELLATLSFEILEGAAEGLSALTLEFSCEDDVFDSDENTVYLQGVNGGVNVVPAPAYVAGDLNGDGNINNRDLAAMQQYLNGWDITADEAAADVNGDGNINNRDLALLQQYLNGWDVTLG